MKRCLRGIGYDECDDFDLMAMVHQATLDSGHSKRLQLRITAGDNVVQTDSSPNGIFQQALHISVVQGTYELVLDLLDKNRVVATMPLRANKVQKEETARGEITYKMSSKNKHYRNVRVMLSFEIDRRDDMEKGMLANMTSEVDILVRQQLQKVKSSGEDASELGLLMSACEGPLEIFGAQWAKLGAHSLVYVGVLGPPASRRFVLGLWDDKYSFEARKHARQEVDLLRVESVQSDPIRNHVFVVAYYDENRIRQTLTFRRRDRARDVWVEILQLLVTKAHDTRKAQKEKRGTQHSLRRTGHSSSSAYHKSFSKSSR